jgi:hypothetical protein
MCGSPDTAFLLGVVNATEWVVGTVVDRIVTVLERGQLPDGSKPADGGKAHVTIECAGTGAAGSRIVMWVDGSQVADVATDKIGPFDRAAVYADISQGPGQATFDDVTVKVGERYAPVTQDSLDEALSAHIPAAFRANCSSVGPDRSNGQTAAMLCFPAGDATQAEYYQYDSVDTVTSAFDAFVAADGAAATGNSCKVGPSHVRYTVGDVDAGALACYPNTGSLGGVLYIWTDDQLAILSFGIAASGDYPSLYDWWLGAGPDR